MRSDWEVVIGLKPTPSWRRTRRFSPAAARASARRPTRRPAPSTWPLPGVLPVLNRAAVECAMRFGSAVGAKVAERSIFARKNYFYPDLAQGLPDQPVRDPGGAGRFAFHHRRRRREGGAPDARPSRGRRRQVAARGLSRHVGHRPQPCRHAAARDRHRARHAFVRRGGGLREGPAHAGHLDRHLRRQHAGRLVPLRRQRVGAPEGPEGVRHPLRDQEPQLVPLSRTRHRIRDHAPDRG